MGYFGAMTLLKNLQEAYSSPDKSDVGKLTYADLEALVEQEANPTSPGDDQPRAKQTPAATETHQRRSRSRQRPKPSMWSKIKARLGRKNKRHTASEIDNLRKKNQLLADRLESLEDKSWEVRESEEIHRSISEILGDIVIHRSGGGGPDGDGDGGDVDGDGDGDGSSNLLFSNGIYDRYFDSEYRPPAPNASAAAGSLDNDDPAQSRDLELDTLQGRRWFRWTDFPVRDPQTGEVAIKSVARDITQQKNSEQEILAALSRAEQANAAKSRFLAMVSHEIRTPLNGIIGMAGLMRDSQLAPDQKSYVDAISSSGDTLLNLIEDLLDTARIESGQVELAPKSCDLRQLVEGVAELLAPVAQEKGLELATYIAPEIPQYIMADSGRLRQILLNLAGNAVKFTKTGGIGIEAICSSDSNQDDQTELTFTVRDSGPGLAESDQQRIFDEFVQTDEGATREHGGAGLGLAISKNLVELMNGHIGVSSRIGRGTSFEFTITVDAPEQDSTSEQRSVQVNQQIAVISDRNPARQALLHSLRSLGARTSTYDSPQAFQLNDTESQLFEAIIAPFADP